MTRDLISVVHEKVDNVMYYLYPVDDEIGFPSIELIHWLVIFPVDATVQRLNNRDLEDNTLLVVFKTNKVR